MIYFIADETTGLIKIGLTHHMKQRWDALVSKFGRQTTRLVYLGYIEGDVSDEKALHGQFSHLRTYGILSGVEWFVPDDELINYINTFADISPIRFDDGSTLDMASISEALITEIIRFENSYHTMLVSRLHGLRVHIERLEKEVAWVERELSRLEQEQADKSA